MDVATTPLSKARDTTSGASGERECSSMAATTIFVADVPDTAALRARERWCISLVGTVFYKSNAPDTTTLGIKASSTFRWMLLRFSSWEQSIPHPA
jgi:hypothetical protein